MSRHEVSTELIETLLCKYSKRYEFSFSYISVQFGLKRRNKWIPHYCIEVEVAIEGKMKQIHLIKAISVHELLAKMVICVHNEIRNGNVTLRLNNEVDIDYDDIIVI